MPAVNSDGKDDWMLREIGIAILIVLSATLSIALPLYILLFGSPISDPDPGVFAQLHLSSTFAPRVALTYIYFPAVITLHFLIQPGKGPARTIFLIGLSLFLIGNGIDAVYRSVQFTTVHGLWARELLASAGAATAAAKIQTFNELAPAITASFSSFFAIGRVLMGVALMGERSRLGRITGFALVLNGLWNLPAALAIVPGFAGLSVLGSYYLLPWLASMVLVGMLAWNRHRFGSQTGSETHSFSQ